MVIYRERLTPSVGIHLALLLLIPMGLGMLAPIDVTWGIVNAVGLYLAGLAWLSFGAPQIVVTENSVTAGRATISKSLIGEATVIERADRQATIADARSWKVIRGWIPRGVRIEITDEHDPTPYWYVSTRKPEKLIAALQTR